LVLEGGPDKGVSYDNIVVDSNGNVLIQEDETAFGGDVMTAENRDAGIWSYNTASDEATFVFELDENAAGAETTLKNLANGKPLASSKSISAAR